MSRASAALRRPSPSAVSAAAPPDPPWESAAGEAAVAADRRRGRGAQSNASGRYEPLARVAFDDGWQALDDLPAFKTSVTVDATRTDHHAQRFARHLLRPLDQSLSRLRARLRLLLRAPDPCLSGPLARPRFRIQAVRQAGRAAPAWSANCRRPATSRAPSRSAPTPIPTSRSSGDYRIMRGILEVLERCGHPVGIVTKSALVLRDLDILSRMAERNLVKVALSVTTLDPQARARDGAARRDPDAAPRGAAATGGRRRADLGDGRAGHSRPSTTARSSASSMPQPRSG